MILLDSVSRLSDESSFLRHKDSLVTIDFEFMDNLLDDPSL